MEKFIARGLYEWIFLSNTIGSDLEKADLKKAYLNCKGCINQMMNCIPFMAVEDEPRFQEIVKGNFALVLSLDLC